MAPRRQQVEDGVLNLGGVLGLVHAETGEPALIPGQQLRVPPQGPPGEHQLVVVVHAAVLLQIAAVAEVHRREVHPVHADGPDLLVPQHAVLAAGDLPPHLLHLLLPRPLRPVGLHQPAHQGIQLPLIAPQGEGLHAPQPGVAGDDGLAQAVDGAEGQFLRVLLPEEGDEAALHVPGGGHGVGDGEQLPGIHPLAVDQIAQPGHQGGGLAAARHRQQQGGPHVGEDGRLLLGVGVQAVFGFELWVGHGVRPPVDVWMAEKAAGRLPPFFRAYF